MQLMRRRSGLTAASLLATASLLMAAQGAAGQEPTKFEAKLVGHAALPASTFVPPPTDAPSLFATSGKYTGPGNLRDDSLYSREGQTWLSDPDAPRKTGLFLPFTGQPIQGFSGIKTLGDGEFLVLIDNGFGNKANSPDAMLMALRVRPDFETGRVELIDTIFLSDPDGVVPFRIVTEATETRYLTGGDFDLEGIQPVGDLIWFGDEFGPYIFATDLEGRVVRFLETEVEGEIVKSPDHYSLSLPATPDGTVDFRVRRSRGFEGMAQTMDGRFLRPMFEAPLWDAETGDWERHEGRQFLRIIELDVETGSFTGNQWRYALEADGHNIGDFNMISDTLALVIERDGNEGDPRLACDGAVTPECFNAPAQFKRVYLVDFNQTDAEGTVAKLGYVDLLDIADPDGVALSGTIDGIFTFPFVTIEDVDLVDDRHIIVANDNNLPFSTGREIGTADNNEFILLEVADLLAPLR